MGLLDTVIPCLVFGKVTVEAAAACICTGAHEEPGFSVSSPKRVILYFNSEKPSSLCKWYLWHFPNDRPHLGIFSCAFCPSSLRNVCLGPLLVLKLGCLL